MSKNLKFAQIVGRLEEILAELETGEPELEKVDKLVAEGLNLLETARVKLSNLSAKIEKVIKEK